MKTTFLLLSVLQNACATRPRRARHTRIMINSIFSPSKSTRLPVASDTAIIHPATACEKPGSLYPAAVAAQLIAWVPGPPRPAPPRPPGPPPSFGAASSRRSRSDRLHVDGAVAPARDPDPAILAQELDAVGVSVADVHLGAVGIPDPDVVRTVHVPKTLLWERDPLPAAYFRRAARQATGMARCGRPGCLHCEQTAESTHRAIRPLRLSGSEYSNPILF